MKNNHLLIAIALLISGLLIGCSQFDDPVSATAPAVSPVTPPQLLVLPSGVEIVSAELHLYNDIGVGQNVLVHQVLTPWTETGVTWNTFGSAFDPAVLGSFVSHMATEQVVNITPLVQAWVNGTTPNYGVLIEQEQLGVDFSRYFSSENADVAKRPKLVVTYTYQGSTMVAVVQRTTTGEVADAYVWQTYPDLNGNTEYLWTGMFEAGKKYSLLRFDLTVEEGPAGCAHTIGFWKTHAGFGPQADVVTPLLPIWLGRSDGVHSVEVTTAAQAVEYLSQNVHGTPSNGITKLYAQLLAAKLNIASGAAKGSVVSLTIDAADLFLSFHNETDWKSLPRASKKIVLAWHGILDVYNNGNCETLEVPVN